MKNPLFLSDYFFPPLKKSFSVCTIINSYPVESSFEPWLFHSNGLCLSLQDMFCLYTPGGGGFEREEEEEVERPQTKRRRLNETFPERGSVFEYRMTQEGV